MAGSTKQAELIAEHGTRITYLEHKDQAQNGKLDGMVGTISDIRVDLAALPGAILGQVNGTLAKVGASVFVALLLNALAWWYKP